MTLNKIVSGGSGGDIHEVGSPRRPRQRTCAPALTSLGRGRPSKVRCHLARLYRAVDWGYVRLWLAVAATTYIVVRIALGRMA